MRIQVLDPVAGNVSGVDRSYMAWIAVTGYSAVYLGSSMCVRTLEVVKIKTYDRAARIEVVQKSSENP